MKSLGTVKLGKHEYEVIEKDVVMLENRHLWGLIYFEPNRIEIVESMSLHRKRIILGHELAHAIITDNYLGKETYDEEDVCNMFGNYAQEISNAINQIYPIESENE